MSVKETIEKRRAYRALGPVEITDGQVEQLANAARLTASCFNNQPWRFVFVRDKKMLEKLHTAINKGNAWAKKASLIIAVFGKKENDCLLEEREYYLFDIGMAVSSLILQAVELELAAHPIAGYDPQKAKEVLEIPDDNMLITLVIVGKKSDDLSGLNDFQLNTENSRPERRDLDKIFSIDKYNGVLEEE